MTVVRIKSVHTGFGYVVQQAQYSKPPVRWNSESWHVVDEYYPAKFRLCLRRGLWDVIKEQGKAVFNDEWHRQHQMLRGALHRTGTLKRFIIFVLKCLCDESRLTNAVHSFFDFFVNESIIVNAVTISIIHKNEFEYASIYHAISVLGARGSVEVVIDVLWYAGFPSAWNFIGTNMDVEIYEWKVVIALRFLFVFVINCCRDCYVGS